MGDLSSKAKLFASDFERTYNGILFEGVFLEEGISKEIIENVRNFLKKNFGTVKTIKPNPKSTPWLKGGRVVLLIESKTFTKEQCELIDKLEDYDFIKSLDRENDL